MIPALIVMNLLSDAYSWPYCAAADILEQIYWAMVVDVKLGECAGITEASMFPIMLLYDASTFPECQQLQLTTKCIVFATFNKCPKLGSLTDKSI